MPNPDAGRISVSLDSMQKVAQTWYNMATSMDGAASKAAALKDISRLEAGPFQYSHQAYINCATYWWTRMCEAHTEFDAIGDTLAAVAATYKREEDEGVHRFKNLY
ncbi:hypothetical protein [Mycobacteroides immunogenum]|nr:hypothetical protein [Mycobacteroides immunogenum]KPG53675.1 hypothetical protein AN917_00465 [Mycobacteroides immunogenum]MCV7307760.1 hypothetical protein [Mycobacteroides immunogenum]